MVKSRRSGLKFAVWEAFWRAWVFGLGMHLTGYHWIAELIHDGGGYPIWFAFVALVAYCAFGALHFGVVGYTFAILGARGKLAPVAFP